MNILLLLIWIVIGFGLRFTQLTLKSPWTDEFATLVFSLGNSYQSVPLDQAISLNTLLQPLTVHPTVGPSAVIHHLLTEDHHPPLYFVLAHQWMQWFSSSGEYASLWAARSLPALLGVLSIPAMYGWGWLVFRSRLVAQLSAAMMAVSPYGIYLAQEARHYTLGILWVIGSLCCFGVALQYLKHRQILPIWIALGWVFVNSLGVATHYFFTLTLCAEGLVLMGFWLLGSPWVHNVFKVMPLPDSPFPTSHKHWSRIYTVVIGTGIGGLVWIPVLESGYSPQMTQWIMNPDPSFLTWINPIFQALAAWITMISLLPVESSSLLIVLASGVVMVGFFIGAIPILYRGIKTQIQNPNTHLAIVSLAGFILATISLFFGITYLFNTDLTRGARYNFVYFPAVIMIVGSALAVSWVKPKKENNEPTFEVNRIVNPHQLFNSLLLMTPGQRAVIIIWCMGLLSGITVISNLGYQKYYRPDLLVPMMQKVSSVPILIATTHNSLVQTGEMMGLAWEFKQKKSANLTSHYPQFLLAHQEEQQCEEHNCRASMILQKTIAQLPRPVDVWLVNFKATVDDPPNCFAEDPSQYPNSVDGYQNRLYRCLEFKPNE